MTRIRVIDGKEIGNPEVLAMIQAFYSRSHQSIDERLAELGDTEEKIKNSLATVYLGYGHQSVGDMGNISIFLEGISHQACKAIQQHRLGNFQESSTRYIDYSQQSWYNPFRDADFIEAYGDHKSAAIQMDSVIRGWLDLYLKWTPRVLEGVRKQFPIEEGQKLATWERATKARAFDIMRGFLPIAVHTQTSWTANLRQIRDQLMRLLGHPQLEVRVIATDLWSQLHERYPSSFESLYDVNQNRRVSYMEKHNLAFNFYLDSPTLRNVVGRTREEVLGFNSEHGERIPRPSVREAVAYNWFYTDYSRFDHQGMFQTLSEIDGWEMVQERERGCELPIYFDKFGTIEFEYSLDFGSWRDIQRHRHTVQQQPLIHPVDSNVFHPWYLLQVRDSITTEEQHEFEADLDVQIGRIQKMHMMAPINNGVGFTIYMQYMYALGTLVRANLSCTLPEIIYITELRSSPTVHPTLRELAIQMGRSVMAHLDNMVPIHINDQASDWDIKRGDQTILKTDG